MLLAIKKGRGKCVISVKRPLLCRVQVVQIEDGLRNKC